MKKKMGERRVGYDTYFVIAWLYWGLLHRLGSDGGITTPKSVRV
jgi:hypothetical protein